MALGHFPWTRHAALPYDRVMKSVAIAFVLLAVAGPADAQVPGVRDAATSYGARLNARGTPQNLNQARINNRVDSRIDNRLSLRVERFRPANDSNLATALRAAQSDGSRRAVQIAPPPPVVEE